MVRTDYAKLSANLTNWAGHLFAYHPILDQALAPLREQWGTPALHALACLWQPNQMPNDSPFL